MRKILSLLSSPYLLALSFLLSLSLTFSFPLSASAQHSHLRKMLKTSPKAGTPMLVSSYLPPAVNPLIKDRWHQESDPYLRFTPLDSLGQKCVVGCVALALGEVMRYHEWPTDAYDWKHMLDEYREGEFTEEEGDAVGRLLADCGKAVNMNYGAEASSAEIVSQPIALVDSFGYDIATQLHYRDFYRRYEWYNMMRYELAMGRPLLLCASSIELSHAFICDGYNDRGQFHILWGNPSKEEDGWYDFDKLTPDQPLWHDKNHYEGGLNILQSICTGVQPPQQDTQENFVFGFSHIEGFKDEGQDPNDRHLNVVTHNLANIGRNMHHGRVALGLKYRGDLVDILKDYDHEFELEEVTDTSYTDTLKVNVISPVKGLGEYHIVPVFEENGRWVEARTSVGTPNYLCIDMTTDGYELKDIVSPAQCLKIIDLQFPDTLVYGKFPQFTITIQNQGEDEYNGRIYFALAEAMKDTYMRVFNIQGLYLGAGETTTRTFKQTPFSIGPSDYYLQIFTDIDLFTDSLVTLNADAVKKVKVVTTGIGDIIDDTEENISSTTYDLSGRIVHDMPLNNNAIVIKNRKKYLMK